MPLYPTRLFFVSALLLFEPLPAREPLAVVEATLATEFEDEEGRYRTTRRKTEVRVYELLPGEPALIYELGLPVIETGDRWHYDVQQRVPLTADRDNGVTLRVKSDRAFSARSRSSASSATFRASKVPRKSLRLDTRESLNILGLPSAFILRRSTMWFTRSAMPVRRRTFHSSRVSSHALAAFSRSRAKISPLTSFSVVGTSKET